MTKEWTKEEVEKLMEDENINDNSYDACRAYLKAGIADDLSSFEEAYQGEWKNDTDFVEQLLNDTDTAIKDLPHYVYIDWERTANDVMMDYTEQDGHYFRNL